MTDLTVREGRPEDLDQVMALAQMLHAEIGLTALSAERILPEIWGSLNAKGGIMGLIGPVGGPLQAGILLRIGKLFYSDEDVLEEKGLFTHPDYRGEAGGRGKLLCQWAKRAADTLGMPLLIGVQHDGHAEGKLRLYERQFGPPVGAVFLWRPAALAKAEAA